VLLALDTSTAQAGIALYDGRVRAELIWWSGRNHARQLMPTIRHALDLVGGRVGELSAVAAARGPGSFTGLRVGLAVARGLAFALDIPLYGLTSLELIAAGQDHSSLPVQAVLDAGRGRVATALYRHERGRWRRVGDILGLSLDELVRLVREFAHQNQEGVTVAGDLPDETRHALASLGDRVRVAMPAMSVRRPAILAERAWEAFRNGDRPGPDDGQPIYLTRA
jgi:tRNA threonylcarbamoyladenosine biosynthesis protein TsaB